MKLKTKNGIKQFFSITLFSFVLLLLGIISILTCDDWGCIGAFILLFMGVVSFVVSIIIFLLNKYKFKKKIGAWKGIIISLMVSILVFVLFYWGFVREGFLWL
jgi:uncharacterized membrane protein